MFSLSKGYAIKVKFVLPKGLQKYSGGASNVEGYGKTILEAIRSLPLQELRDCLISSDEPNDFIAFFVDQEQIISLKTELSKDTQVTVIMAVAGG